MDDELRTENITANLAIALRGVTDHQHPSLHELYFKSQLILIDILSLIDELESLAVQHARIRTTMQQ